MLRHAWSCLGKPKLGFVGLCVAICLLSSSLPAGAVTGGIEVDATTFASDWSFTVGVGTAGNVFCTGSLVDSSTVITAAHCVDAALVASPPDTVYYGSPDYTSASTVAIDSIEQNPSFDALAARNDSAILHLAEPVTGVSAIRLATAAEVTDLGASVSARFAGFGLTDNSGNVPTHLHAAAATVTTTVQGSAKWLLSGGTVMTCEGDSGGPLVAKLAGGEDVLIGATSSGDETCPGRSSRWTDLGRDAFIQGTFYPGSGDGDVTAILVKSVSPTMGPAPLTVTFNLTGSRFSDGRAVDYFVDPTYPVCDPVADPDCTGSTSANAIDSTDPVMQFTYTEDGTYTAAVAIFDHDNPDSGLGDVAFVTITVGGPPPATAILAHSESQTTGPAPLTVSFDLTGSHISDLRAATYFVDPTFDPNATDEQNAVTSSTPVVTTFTYTQPGTYTALVGLFDPDFDANDPNAFIGDSAIVTITVTEPEPPHDATAPTVAIAANPSDPDGSGWYDASLLGTGGGLPVEVTADDGADGSGVASIDCAVDGVSHSSTASLLQLTLTSSGTAHTVSCTATDKTGNTSEAFPSSGPATFRVDTGSPTITASAAIPTAGGSPVPYAAGTWTNKTVTVHYTCSDAESGIQNCPADHVFSTDTQLPQTCGTTIDKSGNSAQACVGPIMVDKSPPTIAFSDCPTGTVVTGSSVTVHWQAGDGSGSGVIGVDHGSLTLNTSVIGGGSVTRSGATDNAGNTGTNAICSYFVGYQFLPGPSGTGFFTPAPQSKAKLGQTVPIKVALANSAGQQVPACSKCSVLFRATLGPTGSGQAIGPTPMKYDATKRQYVYDWKLGTRGTGLTNLTVTVTYPNSTGQTTKTEQITITT
jgi:hypothetical protein